MNAAAAALVVLNGRQAFDPRASLFAHNEPGFWYDPSDLSSMYQDSAGTTPVTAVEQAVGLILDKSKGLVIGPELLNGTGNVTAPWAYSASNVITRNGATGNTASANVTATAGRTYLIRFTVANLSGDTFFFRCGGTASGNITANGAYEYRMTAASASTIFQAAAWAGGAGEVTITLQSIRELAGNHAIQPGATNRPILRSRYNLLTYSEQFDNAAWTKTDATVVANAGVAPNGTTTADLIYPTTTGTIRGAYQGFTATADTYTATLYAKPSGMSFVRFVEFPGSLFAGTVNLTTGSVTNLLAGYTITATDVGNSWQEIKVTAATTAGTRYLQFMVVDGINTSTATANGTNGVLFWGADLRSSNDTYLPYQRIAAATDYDTVGFPVYLALDGSDDSLYTGGNVDFSATDKITLWAGVTKLSDAAAAILAELSADYNSNVGTFFITAPNSTGASGDFGTTARGSLAPAGAVTSGTMLAPTTRVLTTAFDIAGPERTMRVDGTQTGTSATSLGTGNFGSYPLYIGRRNNASLPFNGRLYSLIGRGATTSAALITQAERWVAGKQGRAL